MYKGIPNSQTFKGKKIGFEKSGVCNVRPSKETALGLSYLVRFEISGEGSRVFPCFIAFASPRASI